MKERFIYKTIAGNEIHIKLVRSKKNPWYPLAIIEKIVVYFFDCYRRIKNKAERFYPFGFL